MGEKIKDIRIYTGRFQASNYIVQECIVDGKTIKKCEKILLNEPWVLISGNEKRS